VGNWQQFSTVFSKFNRFCRGPLLYRFADIWITCNIAQTSSSNNYFSPRTIRVDFYTYILLTQLNHNMQKLAIHKFCLPVQSITTLFRPTKCVTAGKLNIFQNHYHLNDGTNYMTADIGNGMQWSCIKRFNAEVSSWKLNLQHAKHQSNVLLLNRRTTVVRNLQLVEVWPYSEDRKTNNNGHICASLFIHNWWLYFL